MESSRERGSSRERELKREGAQERESSRERELKREGAQGRGSSRERELKGEGALESGSSREWELKGEGGSRKSSRVISRERERSQEERAQEKLDLQYYSVKRRLVQGSRYLGIGYRVQVSYFYFQLATLTYSPKSYGFLINFSLIMLG